MRSKNYHTMRQRQLNKDSETVLLGGRDMEARRKRANRLIEIAELHRKAIGICGHYEATPAEREEIERKLDAFYNSAEWQDLLFYLGQRGSGAQRPEPKYIHPRGGGSCPVAI